MTILSSLITVQLVIYIYSLLLAIVKFDKSLLATIFTFQLVNLDYFLVKNDYSNSKKKHGEE